MIEYHCNNCGKKFKPKDYVKLEIMYTSDDRNEEALTPQGRKCNSCGKEINIEDKIVRM